MISSSDVPACPACGCRDVHPITKMRPLAELAAIPDIMKPGVKAVEVFYACRQCGRDVTDAWVDIQPAPEPASVIGPPDPDPVPPESIADIAARLGIAATNGSST